jgi:hypothetical protein
VSADKWYVAIHARSTPACTLISPRASVVRQGVSRRPAAREVEAQHGPDIQIKQLRWYRNSVKSSLIKGFWMVADFGPDVTRKVPQAEFGTWADYERARRGFGEPAEQSSTAGSRHYQQASDAREPSSPPSSRPGQNHATNC